MSELRTIIYKAPFIFSLTNATLISWIKNNSESILISILSGLLVTFIAVIISEKIEVYFGHLFGLSEKNKILTFLGLAMGGILLALQAVIANKRAVAMEKAANAQADAAKQQAKANQNTEQGQRQERLKNAIEHLGSSSDSVRLGGIYELFHLAEDTTEWRQTILDILCAHIRRTTSEEDYQDKHQREPSEEIQSMLTLLFVQEHTLFKGHRANLEGTWLNGANLCSARLQGAKLINARLQKARLDDAQLQGAKLSNAQLQCAWFSNASLLGAQLDHASLQLAWLNSTQLQGAYLPNANLQVANLFNAQLQGAILTGTLLQGALFVNTNLQGVTCLSSSISFKENIKNQVGKIPKFLLYPSVIFSGGIRSQEFIEFYTEGMPAEQADLLRGGLIEDVGKPIVYEPPEDSSVITEPPYTQKDAERWIAEYEETVSAILMEAKS